MTCDGNFPEKILNSRTIAYKIVGSNFFKD